MARRPVTLFLTLPLFATVLAACPMRGREGQELVGKIETQGNSAISKSDLVGRIAHAESGVHVIGPFLSWGDPHPFDPQLLLADAKRMERVYARRGYYEAVVTPDEPVKKDGRADLKFQVVEHDPTRLTEVSIRFADGLSQQTERELIEGLPLLGEAAFLEPKTLQVEIVPVEEAEPAPEQPIERDADGDPKAPPSVVAPRKAAVAKVPVPTTRELRVWDCSLERGGPAPVLDEDQYDALKQALLSRVKALGHVSADVRGEVYVDRTPHTAAATIVVVPGPRYRVEKVVVFGAQAVTRLRVAQAADVAEGAPITPRTLAEVQRRVYGLGVFSLVQVDLGLFRKDPDARSGSAPIVITVSEAPFVSTEVGLGVEADQARQLVQLRLKGVHRNVFGGLRKGTVDGAVGYVWLPTLFEHVARNAPESARGWVGRASLELVQPRIGLLPVDFVSAVDFAHDLTQAFQFTRVGAQFAFPTSFDGALRPFKLVPSVHFEQYWGDATGTGSTASSGACGPAVGVVGSLACRILYGELRATWDGRDDQMATHSGLFAQVTGQLAGTGLSEFAYARIQPEMRGFVPLHDRLTFAVRGRYGALLPLGGRAPPGVALFFGGGANSVRTTGAQQLGPRRYTLQLADGVPRANVPAPMGGTRLVEGSVELRWHPTGGAFSVAAYVDGGAISTRDEWLPDPALFQWGPGLGVRYHIEGVGPVRFDLAVRMPGYPTTPTVVDPGDTGESTDPANYTITPRCNFESFTCYQETLLGLGVNFFLTLGESF